MTSESECQRESRGEGVDYFCTKVGSHALHFLVVSGVDMSRCVAVRTIARIGKSIDCCSTRRSFLGTVRSPLHVSRLPFYRNASLCRLASSLHQPFQRYSPPAVWNPRFAGSRCADQADAVSQHRSSCGETPLVPGKFPDLPEQRVCVAADVPSLSRSGRAVSWPCAYLVRAPDL